MTQLKKALDAFRDIYSPKFHFVTLFAVMTWVVGQQAFGHNQTKSDTTLVAQLVNLIFAVVLIAWLYAVAPLTHAKYKLVVLSVLALTQVYMAVVDFAEPSIPIAAFYAICVTWLMACIYLGENAVPDERAKLKKTDPTDT